jgi:hypothetical protein
LNASAFGVVLSLCAVSATLSAQSVAVQRSTSDSLGLHALNDVLHVVPGPLSMELTRGRLSIVAPRMAKITMGSQHTVWGRSRRRTGFSYELVFAADSGGLLSRAISDASPMVAFSVQDGSDDTDSILVRAPAYDAMRARLGPPDFCDRDTLLADDVATIIVKAQAGWVRGDIGILHTAGYEMRDQPYRMKEFVARFNLAIDVFRNTDKLIRRPMPQRHDTPCFFTEAEIRSYRVPLDSAAYVAMRATLLGRPERPPRAP